MTIELILLALLFVLVLYPIVKSLCSRSYLMQFQPINVVSLIYCYYFCIGSLFNIFIASAEVFGISVRNFYATGLLTVIAAFLSIYIGYRIPLGVAIGRMLPRYEPREEVNGLLAKRGMLFVTISLIGFLLYTIVAKVPITKYLLPGILVTSPDYIESSGTEINYLLLLLDMFTGGFICLLLSKKVRLRWWWYCSCIPFLLISLSLGFRFRVILFLIAIVIARHFKMHRRISFVWILVTMVVMFFIVGWLGLNRGSIRTGQHIKQSDNAKIVQAIMADTGIFQTFMITQQTVPSQYDFAYFRPLYMLITSPIPRAWWPGKPARADYLTNVSLSLGSGGHNYGAAVPHFGEYYLAFGYLGIILGCFSFGLLCRVLWTWFCKNISNTYFVAFYTVAISFILIIIHRGYLPQVTWYFCFTVLPLLVMMHIDNRKITSRRFIC